MNNHTRMGLAVGIALVSVAAAASFVVFGMRVGSNTIQAGLQPTFTKEDGMYGAYKNLTNRKLSTVIVHFTFKDAAGARIGEDYYTTSNLGPGQRWEFKLKVPDGTKRLDYPTVTAD